MFKNILKGVGIGVANIIPGVSGGTLAVVLEYMIILWKQLLVF